MKKNYPGLVALFLTCLIISSCSNGEKTTVIAHSSFVSGNLEDCGCPGDHVGGIARRAFQLKQFDSSNLIQLDPGGFSNLSTNSGKVMTEGILDTYKTMDIKAVNISVKELSGGLTTLEKMTSDSNLEFTSANIVWQESGNSVFKSYILISANENTYAVIGFCQPTFKTWQANDGRVVKTSDPKVVLPGIIEKASRESDHVILLGHYPYRKLDSLLSHLPPVDMVIGSDGFSITRKQTIMQGAIISYAGREGKNLGIVKFHQNAGNHNYELIRLTKDLAEDTTISHLVENYLVKAAKTEEP